MRIAIPAVNGKLSMHFGHCDNFVLLDVDADNKKILNETILDSPPHQPGLLPRWLAEQKVNLIIAGGMGQHAQDLFHQNNIKVIIGAASKTPQELANDYMNNALTTTENFCDH